MLEIKNVSKTYRPKKGVPVTALNDVSLAFEDTGMVFILGKSGSGKSTLLNVLGGLDQADSGEFIIKGKSSKDFSQSDFDSYRNTFIGFIFQEYNILPEFTVAQNIALAMELQGKKATNEALNDILEQVDLANYGNRKPNELSGGQKQRVAIARALIKNPEMIMADEPTGALDSNTGKQVFDTLKKLSKTKLVLIVSHDRDFAELYADRIIELKDGVIISDVSKNVIPPESKSEGVSVVDGKLLHIKKGYRLTEKDLKIINDYISSAQADTLISIDEEKNTEIKKAVKINDEGGKDAFLDTTENDVRLKSYTEEDSKLIRSRLPYRNSLKIGASSLKAKPVRLVFTILLCFIAFALFGLADTMAAYSRSNAIISSISDEQIEAAAFTRQSVKKNGNYTSYRDVKLKNEDIAKIKQNTGINVVPVYTGSEDWSKGYSLSSIMDDDDKLNSPNGQNVYTAKTSGYAEFTNEFLAENNIQLVAGALPTADDEIAIPLFLYDQFKLAGLKTYDTTEQKIVTLKPDDINYTSVVGQIVQTDNLGFPPKKINDNYHSAPELKIVGIYDTHFDTTKYEDYLPTAEQKQSSMMDNLMYMQLDAELNYSFHTVIAVNGGMLEKIINYAAEANSQQNKVGIRPSNENGYIGFYTNNSGSSADYIVKLSQMAEVGEIVWEGEPKTALAKGEIIVPFEMDWDSANSNFDDEFISALEAAFGLTVSQESRERLYSFTINSCKDNWSTIAKFFFQSAPRAFEEYYLSHQYGWDGSSAHGFGNGTYNNYEEFFASTQYTQDTQYHNAFREEFKDAYFSYLYYGDLYEVNPYDSERPGKFFEQTLMKEMYIKMNYSHRPSAGEMHVESLTGREEFPFTVVGKYIPRESYDSIVCVSDEVYGMFGGIEKGIYGFALGKMPYNNAAALSKAVKFSEKEQDHCVFRLQNEATVIIDYIGEMIETLSQVFLYVGIGFAVFASLMMFNFISVSISYKKREIGILRAVGARSSDVFGIFLNESMIITLINCFLSIVTTAVVSIVLNGIFRGYGLPITILSFGFRQIALILGLGILVAFISSFFPVMKIAKKRPIDAIQNR